ncbi:hypothetical protein LINGRAHAP2_LOCUS917 [Linum grandiflorum]
MIILSWNCRGLGQSRAVDVLGELFNTHRPDIVFLSETFVGRSRIEGIKARYDFEGCLVVDNIGHSGGLAVLWKDKVKVTLKFFHRHFIDMEVEDASSVSFRLTGFYGLPERARRRESWELIRMLAGMSTEPWCLVGDFNDLLTDLVGGFQEVVIDRGLIDMPLFGYPYTWSRAKGKPHGVEERLDRCLYNTGWGQLFPEAQLSNLIAPISDHTPILLMTQPEPMQQGRRRFRFESQWTLLPMWKTVVTKSWAEEGNVSITRRLDRCAAALTEWSRGHKSHFKKDIKRLFSLLTELRARDDDESLIQYEGCQTELLLTMQRESAHWKQRAKHYWYKSGE